MKNRTSCLKLSRQEQKLDSKNETEGRRIVIIKSLSTPEEKEKGRGGW